jgi:COP9 signalosome complex subunit 1
MGPCSIAIADVQPTLLLNPFVAPHLSNLMDLIRTRAIVQYIQPFSSVDLATMSNSLGMSQDILLMEIERLVEKGKIKGRIDLIDQVRPLHGTQYLS